MDKKYFTPFLCKLDQIPEGRKVSIDSGGMNDNNTFTTKSPLEGGTETGYNRSGPLHVQDAERERSVSSETMIVTLQTPQQL